jgi:hypothetical protein
VLVGAADIGGNNLEDDAMLDPAALRVLELGVRNILDLDFSWLDVDNATILAHDNLSLMIACSACARYLSQTPT